MDLKEQHLGHLPGHVLFDLARNESATREWRKAAAELLLDGDHRQANHPEIRELILQIKAERQAKQEVEAVVETAVEAEVFVSPAPLAAPPYVETVPSSHTISSGMAYDLAKAKEIRKAPVILAAKE